MEEYRTGGVTTFLRQKAGLGKKTETSNSQLFELFVPKTSNHPITEAPSTNVGGTHKDSSQLLKGERQKGSDARKSSKVVPQKQSYARKYEEEEQEIDAILQDDSDEEVKQTEEVPDQETGKRKKTKSDAQDRNRRTVFVGNVPKEYTSAQIKSFFKSCGEIETVRIRSVAPSRDDLPKQVIGKTKDIHPQRNSFNAYIVFESEGSVSEALQRNGEILGGNHLRVDTTSNEKKQYASKKSVFVGNLPFDIEEEAIRQFMVDCGNVEAIRLIRDKHTGLGKGCGFVMFEDPASVHLALKLDSQRFEGRKIRVSQVMNQEKLNQQHGQKNKSFQRNPNSGFDKGNETAKKPPSQKTMKKIKKQRHKHRNKMDSKTAFTGPPSVRSQSKKFDEPFPRSKLPKQQTSERNSGKSTFPSERNSGKSTFPSERNSGKSTFQEPYKRKFPAAASKFNSNVQFTGKKIKFDN